MLARDQYRLVSEFISFILQGVFGICLFSGGGELIESSGVNELCEEVFGKRQELLRRSQKGSDTHTKRPVRTQRMVCIDLVLDATKAKFESSVHIL